MTRIADAAWRAVASCLHWRILLLTLAPCVASLGLWSVILWLTLQPLVDWLHALFESFGIFGAGATILTWIGLGALKMFLVPLTAMWFLLPLMLVSTALIFVALLIVPALVRHVARRRFPTLERRAGGSFFGSLTVSVSSTCLFVALWLLTLPLTLIPPFTFMVAPLLWGWLTYRIMVYEVLSIHADAAERIAISRRFRWQLFFIGTVSGVVGTAPTLIWLGGALTVVLFPLLAAVAIWIYVVVFCFTGLWFAHYCLSVLSLLRAVEHSSSGVPVAAA